MEVKDVLHKLLTMGAEMGYLPASKAIPQDHPHRRAFASMEREFAAAMEKALDKWRRELFRGVNEVTIHNVIARLDDPQITNILQDALTRQLQSIALNGADQARIDIEREVFGVR